MKTRSFGLRSVAFACMAAACSFTRGQSITVVADHADRVYRVGESVQWTIRAEGVDGDLNYSVMPGQGEVSLKGVVRASKDGEGVRTTFDKPSTVLVKVVGKKADGKDVIGYGGAVAGVDQITLSAPRPDDFDAFWAAKIKELRDVPPDPQLTPADAERPGVRYAKLSMNNIRGTHMQAQIARSEKGEKFPALLNLRYAGVYALDKKRVTDRAADGWLAMDVMPHDLPIDQPPRFYSEQNVGPLKKYWAIGNDDRETSYYLRMYLSCVRAVDYLKSRPDWDGKTLVVIGGSQGGMQSLMTAGLCDGITAATADVPAGCDMLGPTVGRRGGWPQWYNWTKGQDEHTALDPDRVHEASRYFDVANFASRIRCPVLVGAGLVDDTCPAAGVIAAFNQITAPKQLVLMVDAGHQDVRRSHGPFNDLQWKVWLPALVKGEVPPISGN